MTGQSLFQDRRWVSTSEIRRFLGTTKTAALKKKLERLQEAGVLEHALCGEKHLWRLSEDYASVMSRRVKR